MNKQKKEELEEAIESIQEAWATIRENWEILRENGVKNYLIDQQVFGEQYLGDDDLDTLINNLSLESDIDEEDEDEDEEEQPKKDEAEFDDGASEDEDDVIFRDNEKPQITRNQFIEKIVTFIKESKQFKETEDHLKPIFLASHLKLSLDLYDSKNEPKVEETKKEI